MRILEIEQYLREHGIKVTKGRVAILDIVCKSDAAVSVDNINERCRRQGMNIDLSTVYRTLELFESKDIVNKFDLGKGKYSYTLKKESHKHVLQCKLCHKEVEIDCPMQQIKEQIKDKTGFVFDKEELDLKLEGVCQECRKKE